MKHVTSLLYVLVIAVFLTACSGVSEEDYNSLKKANEQLEGEKATLDQTISTLTTELTTKTTELTTKETELTTISSEYNQYKEKMLPYEKLSIAEAEAKEAKAKKQKVEDEKAAEELQKAEEAAAKKEAEEKAAKKEAEEKAGYETGITFDNLARNPDDYIDKKVKFHGTVLQVLESDTETQIRLAIDDDYDKVIYCGFDPSIIKSRLLTDDSITVFGTSLGLYSYTSTMSSTITIPSVYVDKIQQ